MFVGLVATRVFDRLVLPDDRTEEAETANRPPQLYLGVSAELANEPAAVTDTPITHTHTHRQEYIIYYWNKQIYLSCTRVDEATIFLIFKFALLEVMKRSKKEIDISKGYSVFLYALLFMWTIHLYKP